MSQLTFLRTATILGGISLSLLSGCVILVPEESPAPEAETCQPGGLDLDADCVSDTFDNCPAVENAEQLDADRDGNGDACDLVMVARETTRITTKVAGAPLSRTLTTIANNSDETRLWLIEQKTAELEEDEMELPADAIFLQSEGGEIAIGDELSLEVMVDPEGLTAGRYRALFHVENDLHDTWPVELELELVEVAANQCLFDVTITSARLAETQTGEENLELEIEGSAEDASASWGPRSFAPGSAYDLDLGLTSVIVDAGAIVTLPIGIATNEIDNASAYATDDTGSADATFELSCDKPSVSHTVTIIDSAGAEIAVTVEANAS